MIILGDSMTKLLNGWEMAKRIQSNCKVYAKMFFRATVLPMDYMKYLKKYLRSFYFAYLGRTIYPLWNLLWKSPNQ